MIGTLKTSGTSSGAAAGVLGRRDGQISRDEALAQVRIIVAASDLPVSADLEKGFGDSPAIVAETVRLAAEAGLVGCSIEDATGDKERPLYDFAAAVARIEAAADVARSLAFPFTLTARAENHLHGVDDLDDTISRLLAYQDAGADVVYAPGLVDLEQIAAVVEAVGVPVNVLALSNGPSVSELASVDVRRVSTGGVLARSAYGALLAAAQELLEAGTSRYAEHGAPRDALQSAFGATAS